MLLGGVVATELDGGSCVGVLEEVGSGVWLRCRGSVQQYYS